MKSHLHGDNGFESVDIFFRKLVHVMEMATKQLFTLIDVSGINTTAASSSSSDVIGASSVTSRLQEVFIVFYIICVNHLLKIIFLKRMISPILN